MSPHRAVRLPITLFVLGVLAALLLPFAIPGLQAAPVTSSVTSLTLIDTTTGRAVPGFNPLRAGVMLDPATLPTAVSIRANTSPSRVGSVTFALNGQYMRRQAGISQKTASTTIPPATSCASRTFRTSS
jgi:hypothetical protein